MNSRRSALPLAGFGVIALGIHATAFAVTTSPLFARDADVLAAAFSADLLVTIPLAFWFLVGRPRKLPWFSVIPVIIASGYAGTWVMPADRQQLLHYARFLTAPAEVWLMGYGAVRAARLLRSGAHPRGDMLAALRAAVREIVRHPRVADVVAAEIAVLWYALLSWRSRPSAAPGETAFTMHRRSGLAGLIGALAVACIVEAGAVHALVHGWSPLAAWMLTAASLYGVIWLAGLGRSIVLRPTVLTSDGLRVRVGMMREAFVPFDRIASVTEVRAAPEGRPRGYLHAALFDPPRLMIELNGAIEADGLYGIRTRGITRIGLLVDEPKQLAELLREHIANRSI